MIPVKGLLAQILDDSSRQVYSIRTVFIRQEAGMAADRGRLAPDTMLDGFSEKLDFFVYFAQFFQVLGMRLTVGLAGLQTAIGASPTTIHSWVWGPGVPRIVATSNEDMESPVDYMDHGFIQLATAHDVGQISVVLVKRPPSDLFPRDEKFCSTMLPAAMVEHAEATGLKSIKSVLIHFDAHPYRAACKCYMRLLISMGLNRVGQGSGVVVHPSQVEEFCDYEQPEMFGRPVDGVAGHPPARSETDIDRLRTSASYFLTDNSKYQRLINI